MNRPDPYYELARAICEFLMKPILVSSDLLQFAHSALGLSSVMEILKFLKDGEADDDQSQLLDLLLFPDEQIQALLEPLIENLTPRDNPEAYLLAILKDSLAPIKLHHPETGYDITLTLPLDALERYLNRLHINRVIERETLDYIDREVSSVQRSAVKVAIRNHNLPANLAPWKHLRRFLTALAPEDRHFMACLTLLLELLEQKPIPDDYYPVLAKQKHIYTSELRRWDQFERDRKRLPMESLLLQGNHPPAMTRKSLLAKLDRIDQLSLTLYGHVEPSEPPNNLN